MINATKCELLCILAFNRWSGIGDLEWLTIMNPQILIFTLHLKEPTLFVT